MSREAKNYYHILGLSPNATAEAIRNAYLTYASKFHPDKHAGDPFFEDRFNEVKEAYELLNDPEKRRLYDIKRFGKSSILSKANPHDFIPENDLRSGTAKFLEGTSHIDIYVTAFYFINLTAWAIIRMNSEKAMPGAYAWGLFLSGLSTLFFWLFVSGWIEKRYRKSNRARILWFANLLIALAVAGVLVLNQW